MPTHCPCSIVWSGALFKCLSSSSFDHLWLRKVHTHRKPKKSTNTHTQQTGGVIPYRDIVMDTCMVCILCGWVVISCTALLYYHFLYVRLFTFSFRTLAHVSVDCSQHTTVPLLYCAVVTHIHIFPCIRILIILLLHSEVDRVVRYMFLLSVLYQTVCTTLEYCTNVYVVLAPNHLWSQRL